MSGINLPDGQEIRKGAWDAIKRWSDKSNGELQQLEERTNLIASDGGTPLALAIDHKALGVIQLEDIIKPGIQERFARLRKMGVKTVMVTGDNPLTAKYIANQAGVDDFIAEAKPEDKMNYIKDEQRAGKLVAMMGDGTNDAPALAQADVGVAMNSGTQAAKEASNMVDLDSDPTKLLEVIEIGKQLLITRGNVTTFSIANDRSQVFCYRARALCGYYSRPQCPQYHGTQHAGIGHSFGRDLQRDHHSDADSAGLAGCAVQAYRCLRPAHPQPTNLRTGRGHRSFYWY